MTPQKNFKPMNLLKDSYAETGEQESVQEICRKYWEQGLQFQTQWESNQARQCYLKALEIDSSYQPAYIQLGHLAIRENKLEEALHYFKEAEAIVPNSEHSLVGLGYYYLKQNDLTEARLHFEKAVAVNPESLGAHLGMGDVLAKENYPMQALREYDKALKFHPGSAEYIHMGRAYIFKENGLFADAIRELQQALEFNPLNLDAYKELGSCNEALENKAEAVKYYRLLVRLYSDEEQISDLSQKIHFLEAR